jgi:hypothetical protein
MARCPFYGCRWPDRSPQLDAVGGNECGLDVDEHGPCHMEAEGRLADFFACPVVQRMDVMLTASEGIVRFPEEETVVTLREWKRRNRA